MSYFDDLLDAWFDNDCQGSPEEYGELYDVPEEKIDERPEAMPRLPPQ